MSATSGMVRSSAIWQNGSTLITPPDKASKRLFETRSSKKSGARLSSSITASRPPAPRWGEHLRRLDSAVGHQDTTRRPFVLNRGGEVVRELAVMGYSNKWGRAQLDAAIIPL